MGTPEAVVAAVATKNVAVDLFAKFATDEVAEEQGFETPIPGCGDTLFKVARVNNKSYLKLFQKLYKQNKAVIEGKGPLAEAKSEEIYVTVMARTILLGWAGEVNIKGVMTSYSVAAAETMLKLKEFRAAVTKISEDVENYLAVKEAEEEKN